MNAFTHLGISHVIEKAIKKDLGVKLDTLSFMYGNIKPDISRRLSNIPHYKNSSMDFLKAEIRELMNCKIDKDSKCSRSFSEKLGIVTHFISDYFCYVHSSKYHGSMVGHYLYEAKLSHFCQTNSRFMNPTNYTKFKNLFVDHKSICNLIDSLHRRYMEKKPSFALDIIFTLKTCIVFTHSLISYCMEEEMETAA